MSTTFKTFLESTIIQDESLSLDEVLTVIQTRGKKYLELIKNDVSHKVLYRGAKVRFQPNAIIKTVRENRRPLNMKLGMHEAADDFFKEKFGIKFRSQSIFCVGSPKTAEGYGDVYVIIPLDDFDFCWTEAYKDLFMFLEMSITMNKDVSDLTPENVKKLVKTNLEAVDFNFNDSSTIDDYFLNCFRHEMMIHCSEYLLIDKYFFEDAVLPKLSAL